MCRANGVFNLKMKDFEVNLAILAKPSEGSPMNRVPGMDVLTEEELMYGAGGFIPPRREDLA